MFKFTASLPLHTHKQPNGQTTAHSTYGFTALHSPQLLLLRVENTLQPLSKPALLFLGRTKDGNQIRYIVPLINITAL